MIVVTGARDSVQKSDPRLLSEGRDNPTPLLLVLVFRLEPGETDFGDSKVKHKNLLVGETSVWTQTQV